MAAKAPATAPALTKVMRLTAEEVAYLLSPEALAKTRKRAQEKLGYRAGAYDTEIAL